MILPTGTTGRERYPAYLTIFVIVLNVAFFMVEEVILRAQGQEGFLNILSQVTFNVCKVGTDPLPQLALTGLASMFLHAGIAHILGNMWFLWIFGRKVEQYFGRIWFLVFYVAAGYMAIVGHILFGGVTCNTVTDGLLVGASGAIAGVMGAFLFLYPMQNINVAVLPMLNFKVPALFFLVFWFASDLLNGIGWAGGDADAVAHWAHIMGFAFGFAIVFLTTMFFKPAPEPDPFAYLDE
ncbi:rhomboid family intramembrane serine protease [Candidatus Woesebacteria bacterium]|nr:rhomboid family intramembrane serine protease [Candidatus Woesebacteria bacterium]